MNAESLHRVLPLLLVSHPHESLHGVSHEIGDSEFNDVLEDLPGSFSPVHLLPYHVDVIGLRDYLLALWTLPLYVAKIQEGFVESA